MDFKDLFSEDLVTEIAGHFQRSFSDFDKKGFIRTVMAELTSLELMARAQLIADSLDCNLPRQFEHRASILRSVLHPDQSSLSVEPSDDRGLGGWAVLPLTLLVGQHGQNHFEDSLLLLKEMTTRYSAEFAIRHFLLEDQVRALSIIGGWVEDSNPHVRRLVSEGPRPRLPWAMQLPQLISDPKPMLPLLERLRDDDEEYVRRSVANHLNDISKDHPDLVAQLANDWKEEGNRSREKLLRHACRSLVKQGHPLALEAFGYRKPKLSLKALNIHTPDVELGSKLEFSVLIKSRSSKVQSLVIDYVVHHLKANGELSGKVFKWKTLTINPREEVVLHRSHPIRKVTTRRYYSGKQALSLRINGQDFGCEVFNLNC